MKFNHILTSLLLGTTLYTGCSSGKHTSVAPQTTPISKFESASAPTDFSRPSPGKARLIFLRPSKNGGIDVGVHDGEHLVAKLPGKSYGVYECEPGEHVFSGSFGNMEIMNATLLPDRIYYVQAVLVVQAWGPAWVKMTPLFPGAPGQDWQQLPRTLSKLAKSVVTPEQAAHDLTGIGRYMERLKAYRDKPGAVFPVLLPEHGQTKSLFQ